MELRDLERAQNGGSHFEKSAAGLFIPVTRSESSRTELVPAQRLPVGSANNPALAANAGPSLVPDDEAVIYAYTVLFGRYSLNTDLLWRIFGFVLAIQASLFVGIAQVQGADALRLIMGLAIGAFGILGPVAIRFIESAFLLDRELLDTYESVLLAARPALRQWHGERFGDRFVSIASQLSSKQRAALVKRRMSKNVKPNRLDKILDLAGQPSLLWTAVTAFAGAVGFNVGLIQVKDHDWIQVAICVAFDILVASLWFQANQWWSALARPLQTPIRMVSATFRDLCKRLYC